MKRLFDITFSLIALLIFGIPIIIISLIIVFKERHRIIFKQERIGLKGKPFMIMKFQTMIDEAPTKTGIVLRKTGLDEILQFFNVLKGEMSIVGPRALTNYDIKRLKWDGTYHSIRWSVKPGISGFAQIYGGQNKKTSWFWDKKYTENSNLLTDLGIILVSFSMNLFGKTRIRNVIWSNKNLK
jgi:lipopolysaccharide/colanic/teichoic acid biosynthesis glycosyltransferase